MITVLHHILVLIRELLAGGIIINVDFPESLPIGISIDPLNAIIAVIVFLIAWMWPRDGKKGGGCGDC